MISGRSRETTYEQTENLNPGKTSSVTHAPPSTCRRSSTSTRLPARARYAAVTRPLWPPPITIASYCFATRRPPRPRNARPIARGRAGVREVTGEGLNRLSPVRPGLGGATDATRIAVSFTALGAVRQLGVARLGRIPRGLVVLPRPGDGVLRDSTLGRTLGRVASVQISDQREGRPAPRQQGRDTRRGEAVEGTDLLHAVVRRAREDRRRWHAMESRRRIVSHDRRRAEPQMAPGCRDGSGRRGRGCLGGNRRARPPGTLVAGHPPGGRGRRGREAAVLPVRDHEVRGNPRHDLPNRLHGRPGLRGMGRP